MTGIGLLFERNHFVFFKRSDALFVGGDDSGRGCLDDPIQQRLGLFVDAFDFPRVGVGNHLDLRAALRPGVFEERLYELDHFFGGRQLVEQFDERAFDLFAANGFAAPHAAFLVACVIGMQLAGTAARPAGGHRMTAMRAGDCSTQREVCAHIDARGRMRADFQALLNRLERRKVDQCLMLALA